MNRRCFITCLAGNGVLAASAAAQPKVPARRIGFLSFGSPFPVRAYWDPLWKLGWIQDRTLAIEYRFAMGRTELLQQFAEELVRAKVDLIVALGTVAGLAAKRATATLPIVFHRAADPVGTGLVASLARPGGNLTGTTTFSREVDPKRLELLRELLPGITRIGELSDPLNPFSAVARSSKEEVYRSLRLQPIFVEATRESELQPAVMEVAQRGGQALSVPTEPLFSGANFQKIVQVAQQLSLPVMGGEAELIFGGALVGFGPSLEEYLETLASIISKVLRGANPADIPVQQPTRFELGINLKVARALGVSVPRSVLARAEGVIQ